MQNDWPVWKKSAAVLLTIALGAIGSGVWQHVGDPLLIFVRDALLSLGSLGLLSLKDALYADVARGHQERAAVELLLLAVFVFCCALLAIHLALIKASSRRLARFQRSDDKPADRLRVIKQAGNLRTWLFWMTPVLGVILPMLLFASVRVAYTAIAVGHFNQLVDLVEPHITEQERKEFKSRFAQIRSPEDYATVTGDLTRIAEQHSLVLPEFKPW